MVEITRYEDKHFYCCGLRKERNVSSHDSLFMQKNPGRRGRLAAKKPYQLACCWAREGLEDMGDGRGGVEVIRREGGEGYGPGLACRARV